MGQCGVVRISIHICLYKCVLRDARESGVMDALQADTAETHFSRIASQLDQSRGMRRDEVMSTSNVGDRCSRTDHNSYTCNHITPRVCLCPQFHDRSHVHSFCPRLPAGSRGIFTRALTCTLQVKLPPQQLLYLPLASTVDPRFHVQRGVWDDASSQDSCNSIEW